MDCVHHVLIHLLLDLLMIMSDWIADMLASCFFHFFFFLLLSLSLIVFSFYKLNINLVICPIFITLNPLNFEFLNCLFFPPFLLFLCSRNPFYEIIELFSAYVTLSNLVAFSEFLYLQSTWYMITLSHRSLHLFWKPGRLLHTLCFY